MIRRYSAFRSASGTDRRRHAAFCLIAALALAAPATTAAQEKETAQEFLVTTPVAAARLAPELQTVVAAIGARLGGIHPSDLERAGSVFGSGAILSEGGFSYQGFAIKNINIDQYRRHKTNSGLRLLTGELGWQDAVGRRTVTAFRALYRRNGTRTEIEHATWAPRFANQPVIRSFILPADAAPALEAAMQQGFAGAYMAFRAPPQDVTVVADKTYILGLFILDRIGPDGLFEVRLSDDPEGVAGDAAPFRYRAFEPGWAAAVTGVSGRALLEGRPKWVKAVRIVPGEGLFASSTETLLARFRVSAPN